MSTSGGPARRYFATPSFVAGKKQELLEVHTSELLRNVTARAPQSMALISRHQGQRWTYEELNQRVDQVAISLLEMGHQKGDRVGIYSLNNSQWLLLQLACARADLILVNINPAF